MGKRCPVCGYPSMKAEYNKTTRPIQLWGWYCPKCMNFLNKDTGKIDRF